MCSTKSKEMIEVDLYDENLKSQIELLRYEDLTDKIKGILIPESDYGFAEIYRMYDDYLVFSIPTYGGVPTFYKSYGKHSVDKLISDLKSIT